jgi:hypothetical protein
MKKFIEITKGISLWAAVMVSLIAACNFPTCVNNGDKGGIFASVICTLIGIFWASCFSQEEWEKYSGYTWIKKNIFNGKD